MFLTFFDAAPLRLPGPLDSMINLFGSSSLTKPTKNKERGILLPYVFKSVIWNNYAWQQVWLLVCARLGRRILVLQHRQLWRRYPTGLRGFGRIAVDLEFSSRLVPRADCELSCACTCEMIEHVIVRLPTPCCLPSESWLRRAAA